LRVVLFTGKGGAGTTTTAAATAVHAARCGVNTLVLSADPAHSLAGVLGTPLGSRPTEVESGLSGQQFDPRARSRQSWQAIEESLVAALDDLGVDPVAAEELTELPGADEVFALLELREAVRHGPWDLVVVDCGPSTETLRLLAVPEVLIRYLHRLLPMERRIARITALTSRPGWARGAGDGVVEAAEQLGAQLLAAQDVLRAATTSVRLVLTPESLALAQTRRTWTALALHGFAVDAVIANRVFEPDPADPADPADGWRQAWARSQAAVLAQARDSFSPILVQTCAYAAAEPVGRAALAQLGEALHGPAGPDAAAAIVAPVAPVPPPAVDRTGTGGFELRLPLPLTTSAEVDLGRRGDDLVIAVGGRRRVVALPSALRRCEVTGATLRDGSLRIDFVPNPALWRPM
jgi:arsenite-transporting ATPase